MREPEPHTQVIRTVHEINSFVNLSVYAHLD